MFNAADNTDEVCVCVCTHVHVKEFKRSTKIVYIIHADNSRSKGRLLFGRIIYDVRYLMWVIQVGESWCGNRPKGRLSHYRPILYYPHQLV